MWLARVHAVQVCPVSREAFLKIIPIGEIQEFLFDARDPSRNMEPTQPMLAFLPKPLNAARIVSCVLTTVPMLSPGILSLVSINAIVLICVCSGPVKCNEPEHKRLTANIRSFQVALSAAAVSPVPFALRRVPAPCSAQ
jgi:hypothetical protein